MKLFKMVFGLSLCAVAVGATPVTTLTAGLFTFSNITCSGVGCADVTWSASTQSTSEYGGISSISLSDNGTVFPLGGGDTAGIYFSYDLSYAGVDPRSGYPLAEYIESFLEGPDFLGNSIYATQSGCVSQGRCYGGAGSSDGSLNGLSGAVYLPSGAGTDPLEFAGFIYFESPSGPATPGFLNATYAAIDAPEPYEAPLIGVLALLLIYRGARDAGLLNIHGG